MASASKGFQIAWNRGSLSSILAPAVLFGMTPGAAKARRASRATPAPPTCHNLSVRWPRYRTAMTPTIKTPTLTPTVSPMAVARTLNSHTPVAAKAKPMILRKLTIHWPGRGSRVANPGARATSINGSAMPSPRAVKTARISTASRARANPIAVPTNGAEHGVASNVAKQPVRKCPPRP